MLRAAQDALDASLAEVDRRRYAIAEVRRAETDDVRADEAQSQAAGNGRAGPDADGHSETVALSQVEELAGRPDLDVAWDDESAPSRSVCARRRCCAPT